MLGSVGTRAAHALHIVSHAFVQAATRNRAKVRIPASPVLPLELLLTPVLILSLGKVVLAKVRLSMAVRNSCMLVRITFHLIVFIGFEGCHRIEVSHY